VAVDVQASPKAGPPLRRARLRAGATLWRRPWLKAGGLLGPPVIAFGVVYVGSLAILLISSFWTVDAFTGKLVRHWTIDNFRVIFSVAAAT